MRLFVALEIPSEVRKTSASLIHEFQLLDERWKWTRPENLHITLKFIGEIPPEKLQAIFAALQSVGSDAPVNVHFRGLGFFPNEKRPRVLWVGTEASANLGSLAAKIDAVLANLGLPREEKAFTPHLSLGRLKEGRISQEFLDAVKRNSSREFGKLEASEFQLIESKLKSTGAEYTTRGSFSIAVENRIL